MVNSLSQDEPCRIMIVDDSVVIRHVMMRIFDKFPEFKVVATAENGLKAQENLKKIPVDVIILDIEMPVMNGLESIPGLKAINPAVQIIMASTLTLKNADISFKALSAGATDYVPKPSGIMSRFPEEFNRELIEKTRHLAIVARRKAGRQGVAAAEKITPPDHKALQLRRSSLIKPKIIALCASTGGPQALMQVIQAMGDKLPQPIVITQHMPPTFTAILAANISRQCHVSCTEGIEHDRLQPGNYYVAPGDHHLLVARDESGAILKLSQGERENFCRPAADPMLRSLIDIYGKAVLVVMLTGMGQDGLKGSEAVVKAGGEVIAQDETTSVVWGMPGAVAQAGLCTFVLPLRDIGDAVRKIAMRLAA